MNSRTSWLKPFVQDFDPDDIDIKVEEGSIILTGRREVKHGNSSSVRMINQKFGLPKDVDVSKMSTEVSP